MVLKEKVRFEFQGRHLLDVWSLSNKNMKGFPCVKCHKMLSLLQLIVRFKSNCPCTVSVTGVANTEHSANITTLSRAQFLNWSYYFPWVATILLHQSVNQVFPTCTIINIKSNFGGGRKLHHVELVFKNFFFLLFLIDVWIQLSPFSHHHFPPPHPPNLPCSVPSPPFFLECKR